MASFQNSSSAFTKSNVGNLNSNNLNTQLTPFTYNNFNVITETLDLDTIDNVSLDSKVTKQNIFAMTSLINDGYEKQKTNYDNIKKSADDEKNVLDNKFSSLIRPNTSTNSSAPEEEAGISKPTNLQQEYISTIETSTGDKYKDLSEFFQKYHENKKQAEVNQNMTAPGESGNKDYQNKVNLMDEFVRTNFDVNNVEELEKKYTEINSTIFNAEQAIEFIDHCKETTKYDLISKLDDYKEYEPKPITDFTLNTSGSSSNTSYTYDGNGSPLEALKSFKKNYPGVSLSGIDDNIYTLYEASLANPELGKLYSYIYDTDGKTAADKYLKDMEDDINKIAGEKCASEFLSSLEGKDKDSASAAILNHFKVTGKGVGDGIESYFEGLEAWFSTSDKRTASDYEKMYIMQALMSETDKEDAGLIMRDQNNKYTNNIESSSVIKKYQIDYTKDYAGEYLSDNYQISQGIGNMLPSILLSTVSPVAGSISMGVSAGGNSYHQALIEGQSVMQSLFYGVVSGASEATLEKFIGGIPGLSDVSVTSFKTFAQTIVKEGIEEGTQEYTDALLRTGIFGEEFKLDEATKDAIKSGIYGMITAGILNTPSLARVQVNDVVQNHNSNVNLENTGDGINLNDLKYEKYNVASNALSYLESNLKKYVYKDTSSISGLNEQIKNNGLYHFTSEYGADSIINSKYIKSSDVISSYGTKKTFFFNGVPEVGAIASNLDKLPLKTAAVKVDATDGILASNKLKVRNLDDQAISYNGDFDLSNVKATKEYFVLEKSGNELKYKKVSQEEYNNYQNTTEGQQLQEFLNNKSNINTIKYDFLQNLQNKSVNES